MYMFKYILKRIGLMLMTFCIIMLICFVLIKLLPIPINTTIGQDSEILKERLRARGYYDPILVQLFNYVKRIFTEGDFGIGVNMPGYINAPVWDAFVSRLPPTVLINVYSSLIGVPIGLGLGIFAALKKNKWQDHVISTGVMLLISVPSIVYAFLIQYIFCFKLDWFPIMMETGTDYFTWAMFRSMMPATLSLSLGSIAGYARGTRAELTEVLTRSHERTGDFKARAEKFHGSDIPVHTFGICRSPFRLDDNRKYLCDPRRRNVVLDLDTSARLRFLYALVGLLLSRRAYGGHSRRYKLRLYRPENKNGGEIT